jgi:hypothetical protein
VAISAVTLAELSAGPHEVRPDDEQDAYFEMAERARRLDVLQRAEHEFDPIPFEVEARACLRSGFSRCSRRRTKASPEDCRSDDCGNCCRGGPAALHDES